MAANLFDQIKIQGFVDGWAKITIDLWQKELRKKGIGITDQLFNSFEKEVRRKGQEITNVLLKFKFYGRLRDMNVGRGLKAFERSTNKTNRNDAKRYGINAFFVQRTEKRWLNKIKTAQTYRLSELLGYRSSIELANNFNNTNNINVHIHG